MLDPELTTELENIIEQEEKIDRKKMLCRRYKITYCFRKYKMMQIFVYFIRNDLVTMDMANDEQNQLAQKIREFISNTRPKNSNIKKEKENVRNIALTLRQGREMVYKTFESGIISLPLHDD